jgi:hypothetical protein
VAAAQRDRGQVAPGRTARGRKSFRRNRATKKVKPRGKFRVEPHPNSCDAAKRASFSAMFLRFLSVLVLALAPLLGHATTVVPPSFAELVNEADAIYRGRVTAVEPRRVERPDGSNVIKTFVTVAVDKVLKGPDEKEVTLQFLGGTIGDERLAVSGMPSFNVGDREFVFVQKNGIQFCPLVALMHGRYRVLHDDAAGRDYVARDNRAPLTDVSEVELPMNAVPATVRAATDHAAVSRALSPAAFEASIASEVQRPTMRARPN